MTEKEIKLVVRETVKETLMNLGIDVDDPIEVQKDFQILREWREDFAKLRTKAVLTAIAAITAGALAALWVGVKSYLVK